MAQVALGDVPKEMKKIRGGVAAGLKSKRQPQTEIQRGQTKAPREKQRQASHKRVGRNSQNTAATQQLNATEGLRASISNMPEEFTNIDHVPLEEDLRQLSLGATRDWATTLPQASNRSEPLEISADSVRVPTTEADALAYCRQSGEHPALANLKRHTPHFQSLVKGLILKAHIQGQNDVDAELQSALTTIAKDGLPALQAEARECLRSGRVWCSPEASHLHSTVTFGLSKRQDFFWATPCVVGNAAWALYDFGDLLDIPKDCSVLCDAFGCPIRERNQCPLLHVAAGILSLTSQEFSESLIQKTALSLVLGMALNCSLPRVNCGETLNCAPPAVRR